MAWVGGRQWGRLKGWGLASRKAVGAGGVGDDRAVEAGEDRAGFGDGGLNGGGLERGLMARLAVPDFGDPDGVRFARDPGDDVAEASGHRPDAFEQDRDQRIAFAGF